jgi:beta-propeller repeat-containing protein
MVRNLFLLTAALCLQVSLHGQQSVATSAARLRGLPVSFEENHGQVDSQVRYLAHAGHGTIYFTSAETVLALSSHESQKKPELSVLRLKWIGANPHAQMTAEHPLPGRINYLIGRDPSQWHTGVPTYGRVRYRGLFPGVDAVFYGKEGEIEYDLVLAPGVNPAKISFALDGSSSLQIANNGDLVLKLQNAEVRQSKPIVYQEYNGVRRLLSAHYVIHRDQTVSYEVAGLDRKLPLVIDPRLSYSTYIGSNTLDTVESVAVDQFGSAYLTGSTVFGFPTKNPVQGNQLGTDAFVTKLSPNGGSLIYSTILGGSLSDFGIAIAVDRFGSAYIGGDTNSTDFPTTPGAFEPPAGSIDASNGFITKLSPGGSAFAYSFLLGGNDGDQIRGLALDSQHRIYVTGFTCSTNFPVKNAFQPVTHSQNCADGGGDAFVTRVNSTGTALDYSTYLNGALESAGNGIAVDSTFHAYVTGETESPDFPTTPGAFQRTLKAKVIPQDPHDLNQSNAFVTKFSADGRSLVYSTYLGGTANDVAEAIALDPDGRAFVTGNATSADFPVTAGAFQKTLRGGNDVFVTKFQLGGGGLFYSTFLGGSGSEGGSSIAVDSLGRAYVAGGTSSTDFPVLSPIQAHLGGAQDAFVTKLSATGNALFFSTYLGGTADDVANSIRLDSNGNAFVGGATESTNFPTTPGAFSRTKKQSTDGWVAKITF